MLRTAQGPLAAGHLLNTQTFPDEQAATAEQEPLAAECDAALRQAFLELPPRCQRLIALLTADPPVSYAEISARLGIPVGSIEPARRRCLNRLRRHPAIVALTNAKAHTAGGGIPDHASAR